MKTLKWYKIAEANEELVFSQQGIAVVEVNDKKVCIGKYEDHLYAFAYKCPHASGIMAEGYLDGLGNVVCPTHRYKFNLKNGRNTTGEGYYLKHWQLEQREDGLFIAMEKFEITGW